MPDLKYPFCVLDVDGTLTCTYNHFHPDIAAPVQEYRQRGGEVALLSGRLPKGMCDAVQWLHLPHGTLLGGGDGAVCARLVGDGSFEWLWIHTLHVETLLPGLIHAAQPGVALTANSVIAVGKINKVMERMAAITAPDVLHIATWDKLPEVLDKNVLCGLRFILERDNTLRLIKVLQDIPEGDREIFDNNEFTNYVGYSIRPAGCDKGFALKRLMEIAGFEPSQTAAFGDWITDIPMLRNAGFSCAPSDALKPVQQSARRVSTHSIRNGWLAHELTLLLNHEAITILRDTEDCGL